MNAAGTLGFAPDTRLPVDWEELGAFISNPVSLRRRLPAAQPACLEFPGGFLMHTGLPNPGIEAVLKRHAGAWRDARLPVIVHLMADRPEETARMVRALEGLENVMGVELGFAPLLADDILLLAVEMSAGELPLVVALEPAQVLRLGPRLPERGASALSQACPRGALLHEETRGLVHGRLYGPSLFPQALEGVQTAARAGLPIIAAGGVWSQEGARQMLEAGAMAVQMDA